MLFIPISSLSISLSTSYPSSDSFSARFLSSIPRAMDQSRALRSSGMIPPSSSGFPRHMKAMASSSVISSFGVLGP